MKNLLENIKTNFLVLLLTVFAFSSASAAGPIARVNSISGNVFASANGKTKVLVSGDYIYDFTDIVTEEGTQITVTDFFDHKYHLSGSGHIKFLNKIIELKRGYLWVQSSNQDTKFHIQTANAKVSYKKGESIVSFDNYSGKTQILSISGRTSFGNLIQDYMNVTLSSGEFSFVDRDYNNGAPRTPTPVGNSSFKRIVGLFDGILPEKDGQVKRRTIAKRNKKSVGRSIASIENDERSVDVGQIIYLKRDKNKRSKKFSLNNYYKEQLGKHKTRKTSYSSVKGLKKTSVKINIFGQGQTSQRAKIYRQAYKVSSKQQKKKIMGRRPASIGNKVNYKSNPFEDSLVKEYVKQKRHSQEVNNLIKDLENYKQDYNESY